MKKIVIIGAGPAGLTLGYEILSKSKEYQVIILEESNNIGGISRTVRHKGNRMDIGGHRFFSKDTRVNEWWQSMMPSQGAPSLDDKILNREIDVTPNGPDPDKTDRVMLKRRRVSRIYYHKKFFDYPVKMNMQTIKNMGFGTTIIAGFSYLGAIVKKREETSLENFYINRFGKKLYSMFFEGYTEKLWGRHPKDISADWGSQRVKGLSIAAVLKDILQKVLPVKNKEVETSLIEEFSYPKFGPGQLWEIVADEIQSRGGTIIKNAKVVKMATNGNQIASVSYLENGEEKTLEGDIFVSSMPLKDLIAAQNDVPQNIQRIAEGLPYRDFVTVGLLLNSLNIKNETKLKTLANIVPDSWIYVQDTGVKLGRIQIFNNWSPYMVNDPEKTIWIGLEYFCTEGDKYWNMKEDEWKEKGVSELVTMGVINQNDEIKDYHCEKVKKAYPAYFDTYSEIDTLITYLNGFNNLYCIGRNGQHRYNNMDHSMATAFETVDNILSDKTDKTNIWNVNTEKEYHEEK